MISRIHWMRDIRGTSYLIWHKIPPIGDFTSQIGSSFCCVGTGSYTCVWNSFKSQCVKMISHISSYLSHFCCQLYQPLRTKSQVLLFYFSMPWSCVNSKYSTHPVQYILTIAPTLHGKSPALSQSLISHYLVQHIVVLYFRHSHDYKYNNAYSFSYHSDSLLIQYLSMDSHQALLESCMIAATQVHLRVHLISICKEAT